MEKKDDLTSQTLRIVIDSYENILGTRGKNSILNFAKLGEYITTPPEYIDEKMFPQSHADRILRASSVIIGEDGTKAILVRAGKDTMKHVVSKNEAARMLSESPDMTPRAKMEALLNMYAMEINRPPDFEFTEDGAVFHNPGCTLCDGMKTKKPFCNYATGIFEGMGIFIAGFENARCEETLCKASGDDECRYDIVYEG